MSNGSMFDDSGSYQQYDPSRNKSREVTPEELQDLERRARKEGKRDIILSQLVDHQAETAKTLKEINVRLAHGDRDIERLDEDNKRLVQEHRDLFESIRQLHNQNNETLQILKSHIGQCDSKFTRSDHRISQNSQRINQVEKSNIDTKKHIKNGINSNTMTQTIIANVVSALVVAVVIGGLMSYFIFSGSNPKPP